MNEQQTDRELIRRLTELATHELDKRGLDCELLVAARARLAQPEHEGPTCEEICKTLAELDAAIKYDDAYEQGGASDEMKHAYDLIERLSRHKLKTLSPILLSERYPTEADCDHGQWVWAAGPAKDWKRMHWCMKWENTPFKWWLPHWALPVPDTTNPAQ